MSGALHWLTEPWGSPVVRDAMLALITVGALGGLLGVFIVVRGVSFTTEALTHIAFPGAVLATAAGGSIIAGGLVAALVGAGAIALARRVRVTGEDTAIGVVYTGAFAGGAILASTLGPFDRDISSFLFGSLLGVSRGDLVVTVVTALAVATTLGVIRRPLILSSFDGDSTVARHTRLALDGLFLLLVAVTVVVTARAVGNVLAVALAVTPAATSRILCRRLGPTIVVSVLAGIAAAVGGIYLSYYAGVAAGGATVLTATGMLLVALTLSPRSGPREWLRRAPGGRPAHT